MAAAHHLGAGVHQQANARKRLGQPRGIGDRRWPISLAEREVEVGAHQHDLALQVDALGECLQRVLLRWRGRESTAEQRRGQGRARCVLEERRRAQHR